MEFTIVYKKAPEEYIGFVKELSGAPQFPSSFPHNLLS